MKPSSWPASYCVACIYIQCSVFTFHSSLGSMKNVDDVEFGSFTLLLLYEATGMVSLRELQCSLP